MLLAIGTRVKFKYTGEEGVVSALLGDGMVNVYLEEDDMEIPAFPEDLMRVEVAAKRQETAHVIKLPESPAPKMPPAQEPSTQYAILKSLGIQLAFLPQANPDGTIHRYEVYLINDTNSPVLFSIELLLKDSSGETKHGKLEPASFQLTGLLLFDQLNEAPAYEIECRRILTNGTGPRLFKSLRIKPQQFFKNTRMAPLLNKQVHWYRIFENLEPEAKQAEKKEDLRAYTKENVRLAKKDEPIYGDWRDTLPGVQEFAEFVNEIDLHIERLTDRYQKLSNAEILRIQMGHFEAFINKAIRLGVQNVFIIHGVGKGVLRDAVTQRLRQRPEVAIIKNDYHPKYGWGATEVIFS